MKTGTMPTWLAAMAGLTTWAFLTLAFSLPLYHSSTVPEDRVTRFDLLLWTVSPSTDSLANPLTTLTQRWTQAGVGYVQDRAKPALFALAFWAVATLIGRWILVRLFDRVELTPLVRWAVAAGLGMATLSVMVQVLGLAGWLNRTSLVMIAGASVIGAAWDRWKRTSAPPPVRDPVEPLTWHAWGTLLVVAGASWLLAFHSALLPTPDYDAHAYHLLGPKEWFLDGQVRFLPHNVYTSFPFLVEMFPLAGMVTLDDWFTGGLAGQATIAGFGLWTTILVFITGRELFGTSAGWCAALLYASAPWTYRLTSIPYTEGPMLGYLTLGIFALARGAGGCRRWALVAGLAAGAAFGCKYTAVLFVVMPLAVGLVATTPWNRWAVRVSLFAAGFCLLAAVWWIRNIVWTGNPLFPLLYDWLGGDPWSLALNDRFMRGHQPTDFHGTAMGPFLIDMVIRSDWQSPILFALVPWSFALPGRRHPSALLAGLVIATFGIFFYATHRLDRFFLTIEPAACLLAGAGFAAVRPMLGRAMILAGLAVTLLFQLVYVSTPLCGMNMYTDPIANVRAVAVESVAPSLAALNESGLVRSDETVLFVGLAAVYESQSFARYNTVFNENLLEEWTTDESGEFLPAEKIRQNFSDHQVDAVFIDWSWVYRYRSPGNYGFPSFVEPAVFERLVNLGVLARVPAPWDRVAPWELYRLTKDEDF